MGEKMNIEKLERDMIFVFIDDMLEWRERRWKNIIFSNENRMRTNERKIVKKKKILKVNLTRINTSDDKNHFELFAG